MYHAMFSLRLIGDILISEPRYFRFRLNKDLATWREIYIWYNNHENLIVVPRENKNGTDDLYLRSFYYKFVDFKISKRNYLTKKNTSVYSNSQTSNNYTVRSRLTTWLMTVHKYVQKLIIVRSKKRDTSGKPFTITLLSASSAPRQQLHYKTPDMLQRKQQY